MTETPSTASRLVVIGNGMAGIRVLEELLAADPDSYQITVIGKEPYGSYNRIMLSPMLAGETSQQDIMTHDRDWYADRDIRLLAGEEFAAQLIERGHKQVLLNNGERIPYDKLLIATGSNPVKIPLPGHEADGVLCFRDIKDVDEMLERSKQAGSAVVIGGGLLGLEAANGLVKRGMKVSVIDLAPYPLCNQLDADAACLLQKELESKGIEFHLGVKSERILTTDDETPKVAGIRLDNGLEILASMIIMAAGIRPNTLLAKESGIANQRGILVNDCMQTFDPNIYAVGECVEHRAMVFGMVEPLFEQAKVAANHLAQHGVASYRFKAPATRLKVSGISLYSMGEYQLTEADEGDHELLTFRDPFSKIYKKLVIKNQKIIGVVLYGDTQDGPWYHDLIRDGVNITGFRSGLIFGRKPEAA